MNNTVYVVFYDEIYRGFSDRGGEMRKIDGVYVSMVDARNRVRELDKFKHITFADFEAFEVTK